MGKKLLYVSGQKAVSEQKILYDQTKTIWGTDGIVIQEPNNLVCHVLGFAKVFVKRGSERLCDCVRRRLCITKRVAYLFHDCDIG